MLAVRSLASTSRRWRPLLRLLSGARRAGHRSAICLWRKRSQCDNCWRHNSLHIIRTPRISVLECPVTFGTPTLRPSLCLPTSSLTWSRSSLVSQQSQDWAMCSSASGRDRMPAIWQSKAFKCCIKKNDKHLVLHSYARDIGPRILEFFESFYSIDYPLPKQDMAAIPDFAAGK